MKFNFKNAFVGALLVTFFTLVIAAIILMLKHCYTAMTAAIIAFVIDMFALAGIASDD